MFFRPLKTIFLAVLLMTLVNGSHRLTAKRGIVDRAREIHEKVLTLDSHVDVLSSRYATKAVDPGIDNPKLKCDLVKMKKGGVDSVFLAICAGQRKRDTEGYRNAYKSVMGRFEAIHRLTDKMYPSNCELARSPKDVERIVGTGKKAIMIGIENGFAIGKDLPNIKKFYHLGARYITLSHNGHNDICDSCNPKQELGDQEAEHNGLSEFGEKVVEEMNRLGMMVDVSHISVKSFWDVIAVSQAPIIASHSGCRALVDHPRNLNDKQLRALAKDGGIIQIVGYGGFLKSDFFRRRNAIRDLQKRMEGGEIEAEKYRTKLKEIDIKYRPVSVMDFVDHIDHAVKVAGIEHVGIGSDFDGGGGIEGFNDHSEALNVTIQLVRRGYSEEDIGKIWAANFLRVWHRVEEAARKLQKGS
jgi:microsomal dipeptidase-like Zn-dependent dipeptidase